MVLSLTTKLASATSRLCLTWSIAGLQSVLLLLQYSQLSDLYAEKKGGVYNILWAVVFGFATLNIMGLVLRRFEPQRKGLNFGEILAITVMFLSVFLFGLEMLNLFHLLPVRLPPR